LGYTITASSNRDLEVKMIKFNLMCSAIRRTFNNKTRKELQINFHKVMATPTLTYGSGIWNERKKKQDAKIETETIEMKYLRNVNRLRIE
jgi:hypothetical protein